jgi:hypothetical protein
MARSDDPAHLLQELPYRIELWCADCREDVEQVLARAISAELARVIFRAAMSEHPERRITLRQDTNIIADSSGPRQTTPIRSV